MYWGEAYDHFVIIFVSVAAQNGHESVMRILLAAGAQKSAVDLAKMTPLHHACMHASESCVQLLVGEKLLEKGVAEEWVNARDISGCTPLLYCLNNKNRVLEKVRKSGGRISYYLYKAGCTLKWPPHH